VPPKVNLLHARPRRCTRGRHRTSHHAPQANLPLDGHVVCSVVEALEQLRRRDVLALVRSLETSELSERLVQLLADALILLLLCQQLVFQSVDLLLQLADCSLGLCGAVLSVLQSGG